MHERVLIKKLSLFKKKSVNITYIDKLIPNHKTWLYIMKRLHLPWIAASFVANETTVHQSTTLHQPWREPIVWERLQQTERWIRPQKPQPVRQVHQEKIYQEFAITQWLLQCETRVETVKRELKYCDAELRQLRAHLQRDQEYDNKRTNRRLRVPTLETNSTTNLLTFAYKKIVKL